MIHSRGLYLLVRCCSRYGVSASLDSHLVGRHVRVLAESRPMAAKPKAGRRRADSVDWLRVPLITAHRGVGSGITPPGAAVQLEPPCVSTSLKATKGSADSTTSATHSRLCLVNVLRPLSIPPRSRGRGLLVTQKHSRRLPALLGLLGLTAPRTVALRCACEIWPQRRLLLFSPSLLLASTVRSSFCCFPGL